MSMVLNLCVKKPDNLVNYKFTQPIMIHSENGNFHIGVKEVMNLTKKERKQAGKIIKAFIGATVSFLTLSSRSMANELNATPTPQVVNTGLPTEMIQPIMDLIKLALGGSVLLAVLLLIAAGALRMMRKKKEATEWTSDIIKGFVQILISTPVIFLLYYIVTSLLGNFQVFLNPFSGS